MGTYGLPRLQTESSANGCMANQLNRSVPSTVGMQRTEVVHRD
jgi:hypothetical protein